MCTKMPSCQRASPPTAPSALDHRNFPHIVDAIVQYADLPSKLAFRATSRKFLRKVDDELFRHVTVALRPISPTAGVIFDGLFEILQPNPPHARLPFLPWDQDECPTPPEDIPTAADLAAFDPTDPDSYPFPLSSERTASRRRQLERVRVVDYHPFRGRWALRLGDALTRVEVNRKRRPLPSAVRAPVAVDNLNITSPAHHRSGYIPWARFGSPSGAKRYILHISFDPSHPNLGESLMYIELRDVHDLVIVFSPQSIAPRAGAPTAPPPFDPMPRLGMLGGIFKSIAHTMWDVRPSSRIEFVGLERIPPGYLGQDRGLWGDALVDVVSKEFLRMADDWIEDLKGVNSQYRQELKRRVHKNPVKYTRFEDWIAVTPAVEQRPCPMLPGVDEDAMDENEWADGSGLVDIGGPFDDEDMGEDVDLLPHEPWGGAASDEALLWMDAHS